MIIIPSLSINLIIGLSGIVRIRFKLIIRKAVVEILRKSWKKSTKIISLF